MYNYMHYTVWLIKWFCMYLYRYWCSCRRMCFHALHCFAFVSSYDDDDVEMLSKTKNT